MIHTSITQNCTVFHLRCEPTRSAIYGSKKFDSHIWPTVFVDEVKRKPRNFEAYLCNSLYSTFTTSFYPYAFYNKRLQNAFQRPTRPIQGNVFLDTTYLYASTILVWYNCELQ